MLDSQLSDRYSVMSEHAGVAALDGWSTVRVAGNDRAPFLHNMCTNDIRSLAPGSGCEAFFIDVKGKIIAHAFVLAGMDELLLICVPGQAEKLMAHLDRYVIREDVRLADISGQVTWLLVAGRGATAAVAEVAGAGPAQLPAPWAHGEAATGDSVVHIVRCDLPWTGGFLVGCPSADAGALREKLAASGAASIDGGVWHALRIESGWPLFGIDFDGTNLPQEVGRDAEAIHFQKGCYLGQETIARIDALGHVNKRLATVRFDGDEPPAVGSELFAGEQLAGRMTSACWSPKFAAPLALAMLRRGFDDPGVTVKCGGHVGEVIAAPPEGRAGKPLSQ